MRRILQVTLVLLAVGVSVTPARSASRCDCVQNGPPCQSAWLADEIILGRVVSLRESQADSFFSKIVRFQVTETFRGTATGEVEVWTGVGGGDCGFPFTSGETYLIYARRESSGRLSTSICSRTRTAASAAEDLTYLRGPMREPAGLGRIVGRAEQDGDVRPWDRTPFPDARVIAEGGGRTYEARSAADGTYELRVPAGKYTLRAEVSDSALTASMRPTAEIVDPARVRAGRRRDPLDRPRLRAHRRRRPRAAGVVCRRARAGARPRDGTVVRDLCDSHRRSRTVRVRHDAARPVLPRLRPPSRVDAETWPAVHQRGWNPVQLRAGARWTGLARRSCAACSRQQPFASREW